MIYQQQESQTRLSNIIKSFWMIDSEGDTNINKQKIIPDGYPKMIFHYKDPYRININGEWHTQKNDLIAGQISNYFFLENTGESGMFAIKFQPWSLKILFDINVFSINDKVIEIDSQILERIHPLKEIAINQSFSFQEKVKRIENWFITFLKTIDFN
ncbi:DUF6597 domain-containing transcriptional factor [Aquimarina sp. 2201CG5-10]|uniref:DUF6597 domain-containing transcriptional factor n=1 Tax=Aquimarina callyspongiae TaxID=3098150 RepID=UPI002AB4BF4C|nr:DUF6597 domain-containing transcriptional factor [Aquimarina sp. 2201CG5-10]MDY8135883.1 DUF6597 domain-containing transcriptional factor [Aquimarina sp. 2201CG5-10]